MVDGAHGNVDHVVRHVVLVEDITTLECVIIPNLHVEENNVKATVPLLLGVTVLNLAVQVMSSYTYMQYIVGNFQKVKFSKNLCESDFEKYFQKCSYSPS